MLGKAPLPGRLKRLGGAAAAAGSRTCRRHLMPHARHPPEEEEEEESWKRGWRVTARMRRSTSLRKPPNPQPYTPNL